MLARSLNILQTSRFYLSYVKLAKEGIITANIFLLPGAIISIAGKQ